MSDGCWAVVVTRDRPVLLAACLSALQAQTRPPDRILVVANDATAETRAVLRDHRGTIPLQVLTLTVNRGGAGGFAAGIAHAHADGAVWIWLMDDDTVPQPDAWRHLAAAAESYPPPLRPHLLASRVLWTDGHEHPLNRVAPARRRHRAVARFAARRGHVSLRCASFVSLAVHREAVDAVGLPIAGYFLWSDDIEYTARVLRRLPGLQVPASLVEHRTATCGGTLDAPPERFRPYVRNHLWLLRHSPAFDLAEKAFILLRYLWTILRWLRRAGAGRWPAIRQGWREALTRRPEGWR